MTLGMRFLVQKRPVGLFACTISHTMTGQALALADGNLQDAAPAEPAPQLSICFASLRAVTDICKHLKEQRNQAAGLAFLCFEVLDAVNNQLRAIPGIIDGSEKLDTALEINISQLQGELQDILADLVKIQRMSFVRRLSRKEINKETITGHINRLENMVQLFQMRGSDIDARLERDQCARMDDETMLGNHLEAITSDMRLLDEHLFAGYDESHALMRQVHDLMLHSMKQKERITGGPLRRFYDAVFDRTVQMSNGRINASAVPTWLVSSLEFEMKEEIGHGAYSDVYRGEWSGTEVAIKRLRAGVSDDPLIHEAELWQKFNHPRIHHFLKACLNPPCIISTYHSNGDVAAYLRRNAWADRIALIQDIAAGMEFLHYNLGLHGDLKASNVLVDESGRACITDFGLAKIRVDVDSASGKWEFNKAVTGTIRWMSPERLNGKPLDRKVDVYAFGMTCQEILSSDIPFPDLPDETILIIVRHGTRPDRPLEEPDLPDALWSLIQSCWHPDPHSRPPFAQIRLKVEAIINGNRRKTLTTTPPEHILDTWRFTPSATSPGGHSGPNESQRSGPLVGPFSPYRTVTSDFNFNLEEQAHVAHPFDASASGISSGGLSMSTETLTQSLSSDMHQHMSLAWHGEAWNPRGAVWQTSRTAVGTAGHFSWVFEGRWLERDPYVQSDVTGLFGSRSEAVALKLLRDTHAPPTLRRRLMKEVRVWSCLHHEHMLPLYGTCERHVDDEIRFYLVSPYMRNGNVMQYLQDYPNTDRVPLLQQIAEALVYLHTPAQGKGEVVHGDIKGENVLISDRGTALLGDFGLATFVDESTSSTSTTTTHAGTTRFKAPELLFENARKSTATDVYAFGMLIYQIYAGCVPFHGSSDGQFFMAISRQQRPSRPELRVADDVWTVAEACWASEPEQRPLIAAVRQTLLQIQSM